jgi:hypothetical protein
MGCSKCGTSTCSGSSCASGTAYYNSADVCEEDNCKKIYCNQFTFGVCPDVSWNVPSCGQTALLSVPGVQGASIGSYIWHTAYGYFQVVSVDADKGLLGIVNTCLTGNADPGTQIPKCTCFTVSPPPADIASNSQLFPYVAIDFTAPTDTGCLAITVTTINGLSVGDVISIGSGFYEIDAFLSDTVVNICNTGDGILPGTSVIAQDQFGNYQYPIYVTSSCCASLSPRVDALETAVDVLEADVNSFSVAVQDASNIGTAVGSVASIGSGNVSLTVTNVSLTHAIKVMVTYDAVFSGQVSISDTSPAVALSAIQYTLVANINGGGSATLLPTTPLVYSYIVSDFTTPPAPFTYAVSVFETVSITKTYTVAAAGTLTIANAVATATASVGTPIVNGFKASLALSSIEVRL